MRPSVSNPFWKNTRTSNVWTSNVAFDWLLVVRRGRTGFNLTPKDVRPSTSFEDLPSSTQIDAVDALLKNDELPLVFQRLRNDASDHFAIDKRRFWTE